MPNGVKHYKVIIQNPASDMLVQHARFLAQVSETAAERLIQEFTKQAKVLETLPERCSWLHNPLIPEQKYRKLIFEKHYILIFQVIGDQVFVDAVLDCRQDYAWLL